MVFDLLFNVILKSHLPPKFVVEKLKAFVNDMRLLCLLFNFIVNYCLVGTTMLFSRQILGMVNFSVTYVVPF